MHLIGVPYCECKHIILKSQPVYLLNAHGPVSVIHKSEILLQFFCVILIVMVAQIAAGAWAFHNKDKLDDIVRAAVKSSVQEEYGQSTMSSRTVTFDTLQKNVSTWTYPPHRRKNDLCELSWSVSVEMLRRRWTWRLGHESV